MSRVTQTVRWLNVAGAVMACLTCLLLVAASVRQIMRDTRTASAWVVLGVGLTGLPVVAISVLAGRRSPRSARH